MKKLICALLSLFLLSTCFAVCASELYNVMNVPAPTDYGYPQTVNVAVIDTGISATHLLDADRILDGKNYVFPEGSTGDLLGHGTKISSVILGTEDGTLVSLAEAAKIVPLVVTTLDENGNVCSAGVQGVAQAIVDAVDVFDCKVINISSGFTSDSPILSDAVKYAEENGVIVIASVGNTGTEPISYYPAAYGSVVGVGSVNKYGTVSHFSQRNYSVAVTALGENVTLLNEKGQYVTDSGSSFAAAYVSAFAARLASVYTYLDPSVFREAVTMTARDMGSAGLDSSYGYGIIDMTGAENYVAEYFSALDYKDAFFPYTDADRTSWYGDAVHYCTYYGYFKGMEKGLFYPDANVTRAMAVTALYRFHCYRFGEQEYLPRHPFDDSDRESWYDKALCWSFAYGLVNGVSEKEFAPDRSITRQEMAKLIYLYTDTFYGELTSELVPGELSGFSDIGDIAEYAREPFSRVVTLGFMVGDDEGRLLPRESMTRAQYAVLMKRLAEASADV